MSLLHHDTVPHAFAWLMQPLQMQCLNKFASHTPVEFQAECNSNTTTVIFTTVIFTPSKQRPSSDQPATATAPKIRPSSVQPAPGAAVAVHAPVPRAA
jgi:hypothetical protein